METNFLRQRYRGVEGEGAVFIHTSFPFLWPFVSFLTSRFVACVVLSPGETWASWTLATVPPPRWIKPCRAL